MKIVVIGDIVVPCALLEEAAHSLAGDKEHTVKSILWPCEDRRACTDQSPELVRAEGDTSGRGTATLVARRKSSLIGTVC